MAKSPSKKTAVINLPVQTLKVGVFKEKKIKNIVFQFDVSASKNGNKEYKLVAYINNQETKKWEKINLPIQKGSKLKPIKLPVTLGNLTVSYEDINQFVIKGSLSLVLTPILCKVNPHVSCEISDGAMTITAKPCPPYCPTQ